MDPIDHIRARISPYLPLDVSAGSGCVDQQWVASHLAKRSLWPHQFNPPEVVIPTHPYQCVIIGTCGSLRIMVSRLALQHRYPEPPERMREVLTDREYLRQKLQAVGGPGAELVSWEQEERGVTVVLHHAVPDDVLPSFLRSVLPGDLTIRRTETWCSSGGSLHAMVDGAPGTVTGTMSLEPDSTGCVFGAELTAEVGLPLFSEKLEKMITGKVATLMETEYRFTLEWLCNFTV